MHEVEHAARAEYEARADESGRDDLEPVGDRAGLDKVDEPVGEHLGVHTKVMTTVQSREDCVGDRADAHLQR